MQPAGLYLHVPFCVRRCLYCDFYVEPLGGGPPSKRLRDFRSLRHHRFLRALDAELASLPRGFQPETVYLGGGTPTELPPSDLAKLFDSLERRIDLSRVVEFTCEANPGTLDQEMADLLAARGVTRVSIGVQSFDDRTLQSLGRIHDAADAERAVRDLRRAGIRNLSIDLLFALPEAVAEVARHNVERLKALQPEHVSWYSLEFEAGTAYTEMRDQGFLAEPDGDRVEEEYRLIRGGLADLGYDQYELFSFTRPGFECRHNLNYWRGGEYHGCGPSAHGHVDGERYANVRDLGAWINACLAGGDHRGDAERLGPAAKAREMLITRLRLTDGVDLREFQADSGFTLSKLLGPWLGVWRDAGWVALEKGRLRLTPEVYLFSDSLFREFVAG